MLRYPGGKRKLLKPILGVLEPALVKGNVTTYVEPFLGTGAVLLEVLKRRLVKRIVINDADPAIAAIWNSIYKDPYGLCNAIKEIKPSVDLFYALKAEFSTGQYCQYENTRVAAYKIALHQMSYSGLGNKAGGPLGGRFQKSKYLVDCRWSPSKIMKEVLENHALLNSVEISQGRCTCFDIQPILETTDSSDCFLYLDPPYYKRGKELYKYSFSDKNHLTLRDRLLVTKADWLLSYDQDPFILDLYKGCTIIPLQVKYSINGSNSTQEILIHQKTRPLSV